MIALSGSAVYLSMVCVDCAKINGLVCCSSFDRKGIDVGLRSQSAIFLNFATDVPGT